MKNLLKSVNFTIFFFLLLQFSYATDGYFGLGYGTKNKGLAGAGIAWYKNSLINGNPAAKVFIGKNRYQIGLGLFNPNREFTVKGTPSMQPGTFGLVPGTIKSDSKVFLIPNFGANWMINDTCSFSIDLFGNGGMNTDYPARVFGDQSISTTGVDLSQLFLGLTYSSKVFDNHSFGLTVLLAYQRFEAKGLSAFSSMSSAPDKLTNKGHDSSQGFGFKVGYYGKLIENIHVGATYQSLIRMKKFDDYAGLFAEQGDFDIPSSWTFGLSYQFEQDWVFMFDYKVINYSDVASVSNRMNPQALQPAILKPGGNPKNQNDYIKNPDHIPLGANKGAGFGWDDISIIKFGLEYSGIMKWIFRAGYSHCDQPFSSSEVLFNILAPGVIKNHLSFGFSRELGNRGKSIHLALVYALPAKVKGSNPLDYKIESGNKMPNQSVELKMSQLEVELAFSF